MSVFGNKYFRFGVFIVSLGLCLSAGATTLNMWRRRDHVLTRQHDLTVLTQENQVLQQQLKEAKSPEYLERVARDKLGLVKDGETIVLLPQLHQNTVSGKDIDDVPNWKKWWSLFF